MANKKGFSLDTHIRAIANGTMSADYTWAEDAEKREFMIEACKALVTLADTFNDRNSMGHFPKGGVGFTHTKGGIAKPFPMSFLVYFAVSKEAHREPTLNKGWKSFDEKKAKDIIKMLKYFGEYNGNNNLSRNDKIVHAITKYYEKRSNKLADFKSDLERYWTPYPKTPSTMKEVTIGLHIDAE